MLEKTTQRELTQKRQQFEPSYPGDWQVRKEAFEIMPAPDTTCNLWDNQLELAQLSHIQFLTER